MLDTSLFDCRLRAAMRARRLTAKAVLVGQALRHFAGRSGACWPSMQTLAAWAGCCPKTVARAIEQLRLVGLLTWRARYGRWHRRQTHLYRLSTEEKLDRGSSGRMSAGSPRVLPPMSPALAHALERLAARVAAATVGANPEGGGANLPRNLANL